MKQLLTPKEKFLRAIDDNIDNIGYGDIAINYNSAANQCTRINIEEKIGLIDKFVGMIENGVHNKKELIKTFGDGGGSIGNGIKYLEQVKELLKREISELTNELKQFSK